ncbi:hypothetical protein RRG08_005306 [Elysia crispata]|uniref:Uncharacterized protein n=1 Tax=Elysia crispata TaxID=231223 RepID=A0AAE1D7G7_9GAST|nr:hypothetical protein RRG08_005306 [Elysia crispata]
MRPYRLISGERRVWWSYLAMPTVPASQQRLAADAGCHPLSNNLLNMATGRASGNQQMVTGNHDYRSLCCPQGDDHAWLFVAHKRIQEVARLTPMSPFVYFTNSVRV